eukprot:gene8236-34078_t
MSMSGADAFLHLHDLLHDVFRQQSLPGDFMEAGVWRGQ